MKKDPAYVRMDLLQNPYIIHMGRMMRFELTNDRFTAGCVRPLHHIRQNATFIISIYDCFVKQFLRVLRLVILFVLRVYRLKRFAYFHINESLYRYLPKQFC